MNTRSRYLTAVATGAIVLLASCGSNTESTTTIAPATTASTSVGSAPISPSSEHTFVAEVWADNWFALYANGTLVGEDSVPITTERSFNAETITFAATYPLTIAAVSKDYIEGTSGLEYIGQPNQQIGDGGFIVQITDQTTRTIILATSSAWKGLVVQTAPLNTECERSANPAAECRFEQLDEPSGWQSPAFDPAAWSAATEYTAEEVGTKGGYDSIRWDSSAHLIWGSNLKTQNTILWRAPTVG